MRSRAVVFGFALATSVAAGSAGAWAGDAGSTYYTAFDLGSYQGKATIARGINDGGRVVGQAGLGAVPMPMQWTKGGGWVPLPPLSGDDRGVAYGISNHREIGGWSGDASGSVGVVWDGAKTFQAPLLPGTSTAWAFGVNDLREIVGAAQADDGSYQGFFWCKKSGLIPVGVLPGMTQSWASAINDYRRVVGWSGTDSSSRAFIWWKRTGEMTDLGTLPGWQWSVANAINNRYDVAGAATNADRTIKRAFLLQGGAGGTFVDLGTLGGISSEATGLNELGQVVGWSQTTSGDTHAFVWTAAGGMVDLGTLQGGTFSSAAAINERGQVVGWGDDANGQTHGILFAPDH
jgi:probable HAF family extracellular repeat protein